MSATTFLRRRDYAGDTCKNEEFPAATFGKAFCIFRYLGIAKNRYVYYFTDGNGESSCERLKIESGDLNSNLVITYHDGGVEWSYGLHFKYVDHPETLIMVDNDGFDHKYSTTDLEDALEIRSTKTITDY